MTEKSESMSMKTFFFFFRFGDHLIFGRKNVRISDFGRRMWLNFDEDLFFLETTCFWAEITNVFQRFPRNYMCNFWWLCFIPPNNFYVRISDFGRRMWLNFDEDLFFLETTCFWAEITNVFQRFPRNYMCNFWWLCFIPPNNFYGFTPLSLSSKTSFKHVQNRSKRFIACQISRKMKKKNKLLLAFEKEFLLLKKMIEIQFWQILT